jgi:hypothetical protein
LIRYTWLEAGLGDLRTIPGNRAEPLYCAECRHFLGHWNGEFLLLDVPRWFKSLVRPVFVKCGGCGHVWKPEVEADRVEDRSEAS